MFILLLQKCDNSCKYMDDWEEFNETLLPEKEDLYSHLNMQIMSLQKEFVKILK